MGRMKNCECDEQKKMQKFHSTIEIHLENSLTTEQKYRKTRAKMEEHEKEKLWKSIFVVWTFRCSVLHIVFLYFYISETWIKTSWGKNQNRHKTVKKNITDIHTHVHIKRQRRIQSVSDDYIMIALLNEIHFKSIFFLSLSLFFAHTQSIYFRIKFRLNLFFHFLFSGK